MTDIQWALLEVLYYLGFGYLAKDANGDVYAYNSKPRRMLGDNWGVGWGSYKRIVDDSPLKNLVRCGEEPLNIRYTLEEEDK